MTHIELSETSLGTILRDERVSLGKSIEDVSSDLKIKPQFLQRLEDDQISQIDRPEVVLGMFRSYVKYLGLPSDEFVAAFKKLHNIQPRNALAGGSDALAASRARSGTIPSREAVKLGFHKPSRSSVIMNALRSGAQIGLGLMPLALGVAAIAGVGYYAYQFVGNLQELEVVPSDVAPQIALIEEGTTLPNEQALNADEAPAINYDELYARQALNVPIVEPRDGPIVETVIASNQAIDTPDTQSADGASDGQIELAQNDAVDADAPAAPLVSVGPQKPTVELLPFGESWVELTTEKGDKLFQRLLNPGETTEIPLEGDINFLKAGNATQLYVRVNGQVFGPIGQDGTHIVRNLPMIPTELSETLASVSEDELEKVTEVENAYLAKLETE